jgi:hypothetical protein
LVRGGSRRAVRGSALARCRRRANVRSARGYHDPRTLAPLALGTFLHLRGCRDLDRAGARFRRLGARSQLDAGAHSERHQHLAADLRAAVGRSTATIEGDGQAALPAAKPFQAADRIPTPPLRTKGAELVARRATRRSRHRRTRAAPAATPRRRRQRAPRAAELTHGARVLRRHWPAARNQRQSASSATPAAVSASLRPR